MADANSIMNDVSGVNGDGTVQQWRRVFARHPRNIGDIVNDPARQEWDSVHLGEAEKGTFDAFEQTVTIAEQIAWKHTFSNGKTYDTGDIFIGLGEFLVKQGIL